MAELQVDAVATEEGTIRVDLHARTAGLDGFQLIIDDKATPARRLREGPPGPDGVPYSAEFVVRPPCSGYGRPFDGEPHPIVVEAGGAASAPRSWSSWGTCRHVDEDYVAPAVGMLLFLAILTTAAILLVRGLARRRR
jgi:hypothetical protein